MGIIQSIRNLKNIYPLIRKEKDILHSELTFERKADELTRITLSSIESGVTNECYGSSEVIVSLTTFGKRLWRVYLTIESIMQQSMKANRIVLWVNESYKEKLPKILYLQMERGLEVRFCEDIRSYTKLIPSLLTFPDATIITVDDDIIYDFDMLENLIIPHIADEKTIFANRVHLMTKGKNGSLNSYMDWNWSVPFTGKSNVMNFLTGVGGVLYPVQSFDDEVFNERVFMDICKYADDVWFTAMAIKAGTPIQKTFTFNEKGEGYIENVFVQKIALSNQNINVSNCRNDSQITAVFDKYNIYDFLC